MPCSATAKWTTTPPTGLDFPPPDTVFRLTYNGDVTKVSYIYENYRLKGPFFKQVTAGMTIVQHCHEACSAFEPKDPVKGPYCRSWSFNTTSKVCSFSRKSGCTVYTVNPKKECVQWNEAKGVTSGWVVVPLQ